MKRTLTILLHIGYWSCYFLLLLIIVLLTRLGSNEVTLFSSGQMWQPFFLFTVLPAIISFYSFYFIVSNYVAKRNIKAILASSVAIIFFASVFTSLILHFIYSPKFKVFNSLDSFFEIQFFFYVLALIHGILGLVLRGFLLWYADMKTKEILQKQNFEMEMTLIKLQLDPHFLFNTLNNIDVLISLDAQKASLYLNKLSEIMRFMLYETKPDRIPLQKEIDYIQKYLDLQKIRHSNPDLVHFNLKGNVKNQVIAPMTFIPFIENAFKHTKTKKSGVAIEINLIIENDNIIFECKNEFSHTALKEPNGLGNELIIRRLALIYNQKQHLEIEKTDDLYVVKLSIDLK